MGLPTYQKQEEKKQDARAMRKDLGLLVLEDLVEIKQFIRDVATIARVTVNIEINI